MTRRFRWRATVAAGTLIVAVSLGPAAAADTAPLDEATSQVKEGAQSIGYGEFGAGFGDLVVGIGRTIVEATVYTGKTAGEFFEKTFGGQTTQDVSAPEDDRDDHDDNRS